MREAKFLSLKTFLRAVILSVLSFVFSVITFAATVGLSPSSGNFNAGDTFSVAVSVSSPDQAMNAVSGTISFPSDLLEVTSISRGGSIIQIWVREPSFSNTSGTVQFEGVILNPGFQGGSGNVMTINFKAKSAGSAPVSFLSGSILANDGRGTSILSGLGSANFTIVGDAIPEQPEPSDPGGEEPTSPEEPSDPGEEQPQTPSEPIEQQSTPSAPAISSGSHPDQNQWYSNPLAQVSWALPDGITGVSYLVDKNPGTTAPTTSRGVLSSMQEELGDGEWYVHVRFRNAQGWGETAHFAIKVDTTLPENLQISLVEREDLSTPRLQFTITAQDEPSGIEFYRLLIEGQDPIEWTAQDGANTYETPALRGGNLIGVLQAIDFAGNVISEPQELFIESIDAPDIIDYHAELESGESFYVEATTVPNATVFIWVEEGGNTAIRWITRSNREGEIRFISDQGLRAGNYSVWLQAQDERGAFSKNSEVLSIHVAATGFTEFWQSNFRLLLWILGIAWILFIIIIWYLLARILAFKHRVRDDSRDALIGIHRAFNLLRDDVHQEVDGMGKKGVLSEKEQQMIEKIQKDLDTVEEYVEQKIHRIDDEVNNSAKKKKAAKKVEKKKTKQAKSKKKTSSKKKKK